MKKFIITVVIVGLLVAGWYVLRQQRVGGGLFAGETSKSFRGDLVVPISASGKIEPASIVQIKGEASGEVVETPYNDGATIAKGSLIIRLDPEDEERNVFRAHADFRRAEITVERAQLAVEEQEKVAIPMAQARLKQAQARERLALNEYDNQKKLREMAAAGSVEASSPRDLDDAQARWEVEQATVSGAKAEVEQAELALAQAMLEVEAAKETFSTARKTLEDAEARLDETQVFSPLDGMVLKRNVQIGEVVQSGKTSLTGGTVLMELADVSDIYAVVNVDEADIGRVRELAPPEAVPGGLIPEPGTTQPATSTAPMATLPEGILEQGQPVEITIESFRDEKFEGQIERIAPQSQVIQAIATFRVWVRIVSPNRHKLRGLLNTQCEANFTVHSVRDAVLVSYDAIKPDPSDDKQFGVYVKVHDPVRNAPKPEFRRCVFGMDNGINVEVVSGLEPGVEVYTRLPIDPKRDDDKPERD